MRITTPTTTRKTTPTLPALPDCPPQQDGEGLASYGRRAMLYALRLPAPTFAAMDDGALAAAADACSHALTAQGITVETVDCLMALQAELRLRLAGRQLAARTRAAQQLADWLATLPQDALGDAEPVDVAPPQVDAAQGNVGPSNGNGGGGGGSKVPRQPRPKSPAPSTFATVPALAPADMLL